MLNIIYQVGINLYKGLIKLAALFNTKAKLLNQGQQRVFNYLEENIKHHKPIIWIHAASLGEFEQGRPLIEHFKANHPEYQILLSFFSPSGYEVRKNYDGADYICYLPIDTKNNARKFLRIVQPEMAFFIKYEFWNNYFHELHQQHIPLYMVSCIFRPEQLFFKNNAIGRWYLQTLHSVNYFFVQNKRSAELLQQVGLTNFLITGDTRFDRVAAIAQQGKKLPVIEQFKGTNQLLVVGSSWEADEDLLKSFVQNTSIKVIFAPHELKPANIQRLKQLGKKTACYTKHTEAELAEANVLIIDCMGILSSIYKYADIAYIGGGFGVGIHNTLEAAIFNIPIIFGTNYQKFSEAVELHHRKIAYSIKNTNELNNTLSMLLQNEKLRLEIAEKCQIFMNENIGATKKIAEKVINSL